MLKRIMPWRQYLGKKDKCGNSKVLQHIGRDKYITGREDKGQTDSQGHAKFAYVIELALETSGAC